MAFPYNPNIPQPNDFLSVSQGQILTNFNSIPLLLGQNLTGFADVTPGRHNMVQFVRQGGDPALNGSDTFMYSKLSAITGISELFIEKQNGSIVEFTTALAAINGWTFLPSGILINWGNIPNGNIVPVVFAKQFPNNVFIVMATTKGNSIAYYYTTTNYTTAGFVSRSSDAVGANGGTFIAIGN